MGLVVSHTASDPAEILTSATWMKTITSWTKKHTKQQLTDQQTAPTDLHCDSKQLESPVASLAGHVQNNSILPYYQLAVSLPVRNIYLRFHDQVYRQNNRFCFSVENFVEVRRYGVTTTHPLDLKHRGFTQQSSPVSMSQNRRWLTTRRSFSSALSFFVFLLRITDTTRDTKSW